LNAVTRLHFLDAVDQFTLARQAGEYMPILAERAQEVASMP
jgi:hypothetical protein